MTEEQQQLLRACAKDEDALKELTRAFSALQTSCDHFKKHLWLLEQAIRNDYDSILITDLDLSSQGPKIVYVNEGFTRMTGYSRDEVVGKTPRILQGPKTDRATLDRLKKCLVEGRSFFGQAVNYKKDGSEFINQWDIHPIYDGQGELSHWVSYQHDITTKKRAEASYFEQNSEYESMDELSKRTLIDFDPEGRIIYANKAFRALSGFDKEELSRMSIWDLISPRHTNSLKVRFASLDVTNELERDRIKTVIRHKTGVPIQVEIRCHHHELTEGKLIRACIQNLSLQKRILKTLNKRNLHFAELVERNSDFMYHLKRVDENWYFDWVSEAFQKITGFDGSQVHTAADWVSLAHPDDQKILQHHLQKVADGKSTVTEYRLRTADGQYIKVLDCAKPGHAFPDSGIFAITGAVMDISKDRHPASSL